MKLNKLIWLQCVIYVLTNLLVKKLKRISIYFASPLAIRTNNLLHTINYCLSAALIDSEMLCKDGLHDFEFDLDVDPDL